MKKLLTILLAAVTTLILSGCVINLSNLNTTTHTMYFHNDTKNQNVFDWYLKDSSGDNYEISDDYCEVSPLSYSSISGLYTNDYQVWFCIYSNPDADANDVYLHTQNFVHVDSDTTFRLSTVKYYTGKPRSAAPNAEGDETKFVLVDSNGNKYELVSDNQ